jgi:hypothetical protein
VKEPVRNSTHSNFPTFKFFCWFEFRNKQNLIKTLNNQSIFLSVVIWVKSGEKPEKFAFVGLSLGNK